MTILFRERRGRRARLCLVPFDTLPLWSQENTNMAKTVKPPAAHKKPAAKRATAKKPAGRKKVS